MAQILLTERADGTWLVTRGRTTIAVTYDLPQARIEASKSVEDGDTVQTVSKDGVIVSITRSILRSLTRTRSRGRRTRSGFVGIPRKDPKNSGDG